MASYVEKHHTPMVDFGQIAWGVKTNEAGISHLSVDGDAVNFYIRERIRSALTDEVLLDIDDRAMAEATARFTEGQSDQNDHWCKVWREGIVAAIMKGCR